MSHTRREKGSTALGGLNKGNVWELWFLLGICSFRSKTKDFIKKKKEL